MPGSALANRIQLILQGVDTRPVAPSRVALVLTLSIVAAVSLTVVVPAQEPRPTAPSIGTRFEVASVKLNKSASGERFGGFQPGGRFGAVNVPLRQVIAWAYGDSFPVPDQQVLGGPSWIDTDRFDIDARAGSDATRAEMQLMLRALLADRFHLTSREETRPLPVYALVSARSEGQWGPELKPSSEEDCTAPGKPVPAGNSLRSCGSVGFVGGRGFARGATMDAVARFLVPAVGRIVLNRTNIPGSFSFDVEFAPAVLGPAPTGGPPQDRPSIFTVLQERLGLRLEPLSAPVSVLLIERVERPDPN
jgi:uncharacterized protein (TIGR03435 family)